MKRVPLAPIAFAFAVALVATVAAPATALADDPYGLASPKPSGTGATSASSRPLTTWGGHGSSFDDATSASRDAPVGRAREMLTRARFLDEAATVDEKSATELATRIGALRASAKTARERAEKAAPEDRELLGARAEDLETDVIVSEAEIAWKRRTAADNRRVARELRVRAVKLVRETPASEDPTANACDPPFRFTADGRKIYRVECLK
jgi:hypothetical protein